MGIVPHVAGEYPLYMYHPTEKPQLVETKERRAELGHQGWSETYIQQVFPRMFYRLTKKKDADGQPIVEQRTVETAEAEKVLGPAWLGAPPAVDLDDVGSAPVAPPPATKPPKAA